MGQMTKFSIVFFQMLLPIGSDLLTPGMGLLRHHWWLLDDPPPSVSVLCNSLRVGEGQACPILDIVFPSLPLSASLSPSWYSALQGGLGKSAGSRHMPVPFQLSAFHDGEQIFVGSNCSCDPVTDFLVCDVVFVRDVQDLMVASHFQGFYPSL